MSEIMSLEDMDPEVRPGQVWKWTSPLNGHEGLYFLLDDVSKLENYELAWLALDLNNGKTKYIYSVGQTRYSWKRLV